MKSNSELHEVEQRLKGISSFKRNSALPPKNPHPDLTLDEMKESLKDFGPFSSTSDEGSLYVRIEAARRLDSVGLKLFRAHLYNRRGFSLVQEGDQHTFVHMIRSRWRLNDAEAAMLKCHWEAVKLREDPITVGKKSYSRYYLPFRKEFLNRLCTEFRIPATETCYQMIGHEFWIDIILEACQPDLPLIFTRPEFPQPKIPFGSDLLEGGDHRSRF